MAALNNAGRPDLRAYIGATGSGKGVSIREHLAEAKPARLLVWDPLNEHAERAKAVTTLHALVAACAKAGKGAFAIRYVPPDGTKLPAAFELFCALAYRLGACTVLIEELSEVTSPSWAPRTWSKCCKAGRHAGLKLVVSTQRPAQSDKDFLGNTTYVRCFTLRYPNDRQAMADLMSVPRASIEALATVEGPKATTIGYVERDFRAGTAAKSATRTLAR